MLNLSFSHLILLLAIALIVIGPQQLPEVARTIGRFINELRRARGELTDSFWQMKNATFAEPRVTTPVKTAALEKSDTSEPKTELKVESKAEPKRPESEPE